MTDSLTDVLGIGNAIVDVLLKTDDAFLQRQGVPKGAMTLIDGARAEQLESIIGDAVTCSGGSAANTVVGVASCGGRSAYIGKVRDDRLGAVFRDDIRGAGVRFDSRPAVDGPGTGRCVVMVTPDAQRTMQTYLGASATLAPEDLDAELVRGARITYLEGYLWDPPPAKAAFRRAARIAHQADRKVALSLSDRLCVERHRQDFLQLVVAEVDVLFANEDEIVALYEAETFDAAVEVVASQCEIAALTRGAAGSVIVAAGRRFDVAAEPVRAVVDTTGAGDLYAAGFLYGLTRGRDPRTCGRLGSVAAAEIIGHVGARPRSELARLIEGSV